MAVFTFTTDTISLSIPVKKRFVALGPTYVFRCIQQKPLPPAQ
jgi:hypothetical protein